MFGHVVLCMETGLQISISVFLEKKVKYNKDYKVR